MVFLVFFTLLGCVKEGHIGQEKTFVKFYGPGTGCDVKQTGDGGYVLAGTVPITNRGSDICLIKVDKYGNQQWGPKYYGGTGSDSCYCMQIAIDGGFIIAGSTDTIINGSLTTCAFVIKTNENGDTVWTKTIGNKNDVAYFVQLNGNDGYLVTGYTESSGSGGKDAFLLALGLNGNTIWMRTYGAGSNDVAKCVQVTNDGYILIGSTQITAQSNPNAFIIKTNTLGLIEQTTKIGGGNYITGECIQVLPDGSFLGLGTKLAAGSSSSTIYLFNLDGGLNNIVWSKDFSGTGIEKGKSVQLTSDNGFVIVGTNYSADNNSNFCLIKTDNLGNELFSGYYGLGGMQKAAAIAQTNDNGFIMVGTNNIQGYQVMTLVKVGPDGKL